MLKYWLTVVGLESKLALTSKYIRNHLTISSHDEQKTYAKVRSVQFLSIHVHHHVAFS